MSRSAKPVPEGYHTVTPYIIVNDGARALEFYARAFGAREVLRMPGPNNRVGHAEIAIGDSRSDLEMAPHVSRFFLTANGAHVLGPDTPTNVTVCQGENGLGWVEAIRWALEA